MSKKKTFIVGSSTSSENIEDDIIDDGVELTKDWKKGSDKSQREIIIDKLEHSEWNPDTEKDIILYYYKKYGNKRGDDYEKVSGKIADAINRLFKTKLSDSDILTKLDTLTEEDLSVLTIKKEIINTPIKSNINYKKLLKEKLFEYKNDLELINRDLIELCCLTNCENLCISSSESGLHLACKEKECALDKSLTDTDQILINVFTEELKNPEKAKKLVLLTKLMKN